MIDNQKYHIFISYSRANSDIKDKIVRDLRDYGFDVWVDTKNIALTKSWTEEIKKGISNSKILLYLGSPEAKKSTYVSYELGYADALNKIILPIRIKGHTWEDCVMDWHSLKQGVELRGKQYDKKNIAFFKAVCDLLSKTAVEELKKQNLVRDNIQINKLLKAIHDVTADEQSDYLKQVRQPLLEAGADKLISTEEALKLIDILIDWGLAEILEYHLPQYYFTSHLTQIGKKIAGL